MKLPKKQCKHVGASCWNNVVGQLGKTIHKLVCGLAHCLFAINWLYCVFLCVSVWLCGCLWLCVSVFVCGCVPRASPKRRRTYNACTPYRQRKQIEQNTKINKHKHTTQTTKHCKHKKHYTNKGTPLTHLAEQLQTHIHTHKNTEGGPRHFCHK